MKRLLAALVAVFFVAPVWAESDDISRLYTFSASTPARASEVNAEFNQLISTANEKAGRAVTQTISGVNTFSGNNVHSGDNTFTGTNTFNNVINPIETDIISEYTSTNGVSIDSVELKDGYINIDVAGADDPSSPADGDVWYDATAGEFQGRANGATVTIETNTTVIPYPKGYREGGEVNYASTATATIAAGSFRDSADASNIDITASRTCNISTSGAGGLDTGSEASNTFYYVYVIDDSAAVNTEACLLSVTNESDTGSVTLPSGYDRKRQLPIAIRNNGSSDFIAWTLGGGWPDRPIVRYNVAASYYNGSAVVNGTTNVLSGGVSTSFTNIDFSSYQPTISEEAIISIRKEGTFLGTLRQDGTTHNGSIEIGSAASDNENIGTFHLPTASQVGEYKRWFGSGDIEVDLMGYVVTEM